MELERAGARRGKGRVRSVAARGCVINVTTFDSRQSRVAPKRLGLRLARRGAPCGAGQPGVDDKRSKDRSYDRQDTARSLPARRRRDAAQTRWCIGRGGQAHGSNRSDAARPPCARGRRIGRAVGRICLGAGGRTFCCAGGQAIDSAVGETPGRAIRKVLDRAVRQLIERTIHAALDWAIGQSCERAIRQALLWFFGPAFLVRAGCHAAHRAGLAGAQEGAGA